MSVYDVKFHFYLLTVIMRTAVVSTVTRLRAERPGFDSRHALGFFFSLPPRPNRIYSYPKGTGGKAAVA